MSENFIDSLARIHTLNPEDLFEGFYSLFSEVSNMSAQQLITVKQSIDLGLKLSEHALDKKQETILIRIIVAMQMRAFELNKMGVRISAQEWFMRTLFHIGECEIFSIHYNSTAKAIEEVLEVARPKKKKFGIF
ncbi:MAG: hypothetical protein HGA36_02040 [Candidatus Moranbacteria bacterium]|nr:hypothetical protein [Candidatus Moranbacteria bacterium]